MAMSLRKETADNVAIINAYLRVALRRWLRANTPESEWPDHLWLDLGIDELSDWVLHAGADPEGILESAREEIVDRIADGM